MLVKLTPERSNYISCVSGVPGFDPSSLYPSREEEQTSEVGLERGWRIRDLTELSRKTKKSGKK